MITTSATSQNWKIKPSPRLPWGSVWRVVSKGGFMVDYYGHCLGDQSKVQFHGRSTTACFGDQSKLQFPGLEWINSHQCTSCGWARWGRFQDERKSHPPCPHIYIFFTSFLPQNFPSYLPQNFPSYLPHSSPLLPTIYLPPPTYHLPPPSYLQPTNPTPPHSIARALETSSGCGARAGAVAVELEWLELERSPRAHKKVRCLFYFLFFLFVLFEEGLRSLLLFLSLSLLHCSAAKKKAFFFYFATEEEGLLLFFLFLWCTAAQLQRNKEEGLLLLFCSRRRRPSFSFSFFAALQLNCSATKKKAFFFFLFLCCTSCVFPCYGGAVLNPLVHRLGFFMTFFWGAPLSFSAWVAPSCACIQLLEQ